MTGGLKKDTPVYADLMTRDRFKDIGGIVNITEQSFLELFPKESLIYLSPDSRNHVRQTDVQNPADKIFVIAGKKL